MSDSTLACADYPRGGRHDRALPATHRYRSSACGLLLRWRRRLLLGRRDTERRVTGPARLTSEVLRDGLGRRQVLGAGGVAQLLGLHRVVLRRLLELGPLLPDLGLC